jgi:hypothetical protein
MFSTLITYVSRVLVFVVAVWSVLCVLGVVALFVVPLLESDWMGFAVVFPFLGFMLLFGDMDMPRDYASFLARSLTFREVA